MVAVRTFVGVVATFALTLAASAKATEPTLVRLDYVAAKQCPDAAVFAAQMASRAPQVLLVSDANAREVKVRIVSRAKHFSGRISITDANGESLRSVDGEECAEIVTALAVIGAFALDPVGVVQSRDVPARTKDSITAGAGGGSRDKNLASESSSPTEVEKKTTAKSEVPTLEAATSPSKRDSAPTDDTKDEQARTRLAHVEFSFGAEAEMITGAAPGLVGSVPVFADVSFRAPKRIFSPAARLRFERPGSDADGIAQGSAHFTWSEASLDLCPIALSLGASWRLRPCLRTELGVVVGRGLNTSNAHDETRPWATSGAVAMSRWTVVGPLFVELEAALIAPIVRDRFYLDPQSTTVFRASPIGVTTACGAGIAIW